MRSSRYAKSRQKACQQCSKAKSKCDLASPSCSRCLLRSLDCEYSKAQKPRNANGCYDVSEADQNVQSPLNLQVLYAPVSATNTDALSQFDTGSCNLEATRDSSSVFPFDGASRILPPYCTSSRPPSCTYQDRFESSLHRHLHSSALVCPINAQDISNRWLNIFAPMPGQTGKNYPRNVASFMYRMLKSYAAAIVHCKGPPLFIHSLQMNSLTASPQLSACLSLVHMCGKPMPGATAVVTEILEREMDKLYTQHGKDNSQALRDTFQAYLIYAMVLYFFLDGKSNPNLRQAMINLQDLACASSQQGLVCVAEREGIRPSWRAFIAAESQRRTLYLMYLFDNLLSIQDGLPTFLGTELRGLPAPTTRSLWCAGTQQEWENRYNVHLAEWGTTFLRIDDLWPPPDDSSAEDLERRHEKIDHWLEDVDEFGTMLFAVTSCTHGD